ncbi:metal ABC transporter permease [Bacillus infantis]|uniref:metal ABC transporter permease n=1 Tax=Bacillus infantis TaxID=324767 RepID=UPI00215587E3|nr:metal ABC transporter permease [Bacillus infantis]MCR6611686.1 metal ABC transporter permease [Bacillus infantis]
MNELMQMLGNANTQWVLFGTMLLGVASGVLGSIALLRKQSLIGDAVAHAALPGICIAFMLTGEKSLPALLIGAAITGLLAAYCIQFITSNSILKEDSAICLILSVFFGFGIVLLTKISQSPAGNKSGLDDFIFGQAASMVGGDVKLMAGASAVLIVVTVLFFKEMKVLTFDPDFARGLGLPAGWLNFMFLTLLAGAVVIGIQAVGVILMAAMLITPSVAARYWTESLGKMVVISGGFGAISGMIGTLLSTLGQGLATGPFIVVTATGLFLFSVLAAPQRGLLTKLAKRIVFNRKTKKSQVLRAMYKLTESAYRETGKEQMIIAESRISDELAFSKSHTMRLMSDLYKEHLIAKDSGGWMLTDKGVLEGYILTLKGRINELCLMHSEEFNEDQREALAERLIERPSDPLAKRAEGLLWQYNMMPALSPFSLSERRENL